MAKHSEFSKDVISLEKLEIDLNEWISQLSEALLFLHHVNDVRLFVIDAKQSKLHIQIKSKITGEKSVQQRGNSKLSMYPMTLFKKESKTSQWLVQLGEGNMEDADFDWDKAKPSNVNIYPHHGIAVPIKADEFVGKSFCFLPLPGVTSLPIHVHGYFVLHSDRRGLWIGSRKQKFSKRDNNESNAYTVFTDPKEVWNDLLLKAIAVSYAYFLISYREKSLAMKKTLQASLNFYYKLFPTLNHTGEHWLTLGRHLFTTLSDINAPILAKLYDNSEDKSAATDKKRFTISCRWYELHNPDSPDECYFHHASIDLQLFSALTSIGMNLIDTPFTIYEQFKRVGLKLCNVSSESVLGYYSKFSDIIYNKNPLPCPLLSTKFHNLTCFATVLKYLMGTSHEIFVKTSDNVDVKNLYQLGFIVTADEYLHCLTDGTRIVSSNYWNLFPNSKQCFIHETLQEYFPYDSKYLSSDDWRQELKPIILSVIADNLPLLWKQSTHDRVPFLEVKTQWIQELFDCLLNDPVFCEYYDDILLKFPLLPASNEMMYSASCEVLPFKTELHTDHEQYHLRELMKLMKKLKVPLFRHDLLNDFSETNQIKLPVVMNAERILRTLYFISDVNIHVYKELDENELIVLFEILQKVSYFLPHNQNCIKKLPVFATINGKLVNLMLASEVWIWDEEEVCTAGRDYWINCISSSIVFLDPLAHWACLKHEAEKLQIFKINKYDMYHRFIFPHFSLLPKDAQMKHLKFIKSKVYPECKFILGQSRGNRDVNFSKAKSFVEDFKSLKCISNNSGVLCTVESFYDYNEKTFQVFCHTFFSLPLKLRDVEWLDFLKYFGLKSVPTKEEFIIFCETIATYDDLSAVRKASSTILDALFYVPPLDVYENKYKDIQSFHSLQIISEIPIAIVENVPDLNSIASQRLGEHVVHHSNLSFSLAKLSNSCLIKNKTLVWTVKPLIKLSYNENSLVYLNRLEDLGVMLTPSIEDVISNLKNLSNTVFANRSSFDMQNSVLISSHLPKVVVEMLEYIQTELLKSKGVAFEEACDQLKHHNLSNAKILPVRLARGGAEEYALVMPTQVLDVDASDIDIYYPFLHPLIDEAQGVTLFLFNIGVQKSINFCHIQYILDNAKSTFKEGKVNPNMHSMVMKATQQLIELLQETRHTEADIVHSLHPLYLLSDENIMTECSKLVVFNVNSRKFSLPTGYAYLHPLTTAGVAYQESALLHLLPKEFELISLKSIINYEVIDPNPMDDIFPHISAIGEILKSGKFIEGIMLYSNCCTQGAKIADSVVNILSTFQNHLTIQYLETLHVKSHVTLEGIVVTLDDTTNHSFFLQKFPDQKWILSLKNSHDNYPSAVYYKLAKQVCSRLKLKSLGCFDHDVNDDDDDDLPELFAFVSFFLQCGSVSNITKVIKQNLPGFDIDLIDTKDEPVPENIDQHLFDLVSHEEWIRSIDRSDIGGKELGRILTEKLIEWKSSEPQIDLNKAKIWITQAEHDHLAVSALLNASKTDQKHFAAICFMCHQVAEKSLKAGVYAKCGLNQIYLYTHNLMSLASELDQTAGCSVTSDAAILNDFYLPTRYPNRWNPTVAPCNKFSSSEAKKGFDAATRIFEAMQALIRDMA